MFAVKFRRVFPANFISHVDLLKTMNRILRRAALETEYSKGFNPHMLLFFSPPLPVGTESESEYVTVASELPDNFLKRFNNACPDGVAAVEIFKLKNNPNFAHIITFAEYEITCDGIGESGFERILSADKFEISYSDKGKTVAKDFKDYVVDIKKIDNDKISAVLKFGNVNLRADRFLTGLCQLTGFDAEAAKIVKTKAFDKNRSDIDSVLKNVN